VRILEAILALGEHRQAVIDLIGESTDPETLPMQVAVVLGCDVTAAEHVLDMPLRRLTPRGMDLIRQELERLRQPF
jgi:DNA gyrase/topoisomerase IV subunit A